MEYKKTICIEIELKSEDSNKLNDQTLDVLEKLINVSKNISAPRFINGYDTHKSVTINVKDI